MIMFWEEDEDSDGNPPSEWPEWKIQQHLRYCCYFCKDPDTFECEEQCKTCHQRACLECVRGCDECEENGECYEEGECYAPRFCDDCRAKELISQPCDPERKLCAACASWHFEDDLPTGHRCHLCYTERWRRRRDLVRMVEHCLLLSLKERAAQIVEKQMAYEEEHQQTIQEDWPPSSADHDFILWATSSKHYI